MRRRVGRLAGVLVLGMGAAVFYGVLKLRQMQADYDPRCPRKEEGKAAKE